MTQINTDQTQSIEPLRRFNLSLLRSISLVRWIGYGFLLLTLFDLAEILFPPDFMNPSWEFQTMGQIVERVAVPLLGFALVFFGERNSRDRWEVPLLNLLSWVALLYGILFFLLFPLGAFNTIRLDRQSNQQIQTQTKRIQTELQTLEQRLSQVTGVSDLEALLTQINPQAAPEIQSTEQFNEVKGRLETFTQESKQRLATQSKEALSTQRTSLLKRSIKWNLGALISGTLFVVIWRNTSWARQKW
ncbi:MAG: HpsJ-like protein, cyanoexosortase A-associated [Microcoleaceae cyanobacterium]